MGTMQTRRLGPEGPEVSCVGLGAMPLSVTGRPDEADALRVIHAALDAGMTLIDTANVYCLDDADIGHNERLIAKALRSRGKGAKPPLVATKGGMQRPSGTWTDDGRPDFVKQSCEASLKALGTDCIALYQLHTPDENVPFADTIGALADLRREGKIRLAGLSNVSVEQILQAEKIVPVASVQNHCNIFDREAFRDGVVKCCEERGIAFLPYSPVGGHHNQGRTAADPVLKAAAKQLGATPYEVALAWLLAASPVMIPIPGASRAESARSSAAAGGLRLSPQDLASLDRAFPR
jgi:aryl-alcohol dehydrogenase-like predicted oxidoreductase